MDDAAPEEKRRRLRKRDIADALEAKAELAQRCLSLPPGGPRAERHSLRLRDAIRRAGVQAHAIGVGRKRVGGQATNTVCVRLYVTQKLPEGLLPASVRLPPAIAGIPTDVIEAPPAFFANAEPCTLRRRRLQRPLRPGVSCANAIVAAGTLSAFCRSRHTSEAGLPLLLSNNHVLADFGAAPAGSPILQPSAQDGGSGADLVATLLRAIAIDIGDTTANRVDAALALLDPAVATETAICSVGTVNGLAEARADLVVRKHGRTTGHTVGVIDDPACDFVLPLSRSDPARGVARFVDQIRIEPRQGGFRFAQAGDSGALVVTKPGNRAVGLLFACPDDSSFAYANPIGPVLDMLEIDLA